MIELTGEELPNYRKRHPEMKQSNIMMEKLFDDFVEYFSMIPEGSLDGARANKLVEELSDKVIYKLNECMPMEHSQVMLVSCYIESSIRRSKAKMEVRKSR